ncbi:Proton-coupled amino acid transporter-like protein pathetic, partial [Pseudolycoriella hygida]
MIDQNSDKIEVPVKVVLGSQLPLCVDPVHDENPDYNPFEHRRLEHPTTNAETLAHLLKGSLGSGILAMPLAFAHAGLWFGLGAMIFVGFICTYCVHILIKCEHIMCRRTQTPSFGYAELATSVFANGPGILHRWSRFAGLVINTFIVMTLFGCCCVYNVFVATNVKQVVEHYTDFDYNLRWYILLMLPFLILLNLIRDLKSMAVFSVVANIFVSLCLVVTAYYIFRDDLPVVTDRIAMANCTKMPIFFGTAVFALEAIGVVMTLENNMKTPQNFIGCPSVLNTGMLVVVILYTTVGFFGYWKYGDDTAGSITLNLPTEEILAQSVKLMIAIAIFLTYCLQFYVPMNITWINIRDKFSENNKQLAEYATRFLLITSTVVLAIAIPTIGPFMSLIGAVCVSTLGRPGFGTLKWILVKDVLLILFGVAGFVIGTYVSVLEIDESLTRL